MMWETDCVNRIIKYRICDPGCSKPIIVWVVSSQTWANKVHLAGGYD